MSVDPPMTDLSHLEPIDRLERIAVGLDAAARLVHVTDFREVLDRARIQVLEVAAELRRRG